MDEKTTRYDLTEGSIFRKILLYALPIFLGSIFQSLYTTADAVILGRFGGKEALAAIESVFTLTRIPVNLFLGVGIGASLILAQAFGAKRYGDVSRMSHTAVLFSMIGGVVLAIVGCVVSPFAIRLIHVPAEIVAEAQDYLLIYYLGMAASLIFNVGSGIFNALGNTRQPFVYLVVANITNVALDIVFIIIFHWGVIGAAAATGISQVVCAFLVIRALMKTDQPCRITLQKLRIDWRILKRILVLGFPTGIQSAMYPFANAIVQTSINSFGVNAIAAWAVCGKLDFLIWSVSDAFGVTVSTFVAQNNGAKKPERLKSSIKIGFALSFTIICLISCVLFFWGETLGSYLVQDVEVIALIGLIFRFIAPTYWLYVPCDVVSGSIRGMGDTVRPMFVSILSVMLIRALWVWVAVPFRPSLLMTLACYPLSWLIGALLYTYVLYHHLKIQRIGEAVPKQISG